MDADRNRRRHSNSKGLHDDDASDTDDTDDDFTYGGSVGSPSTDDESDEGDAPHAADSGDAHGHGTADDDNYGEGGFADFVDDEDNYYDPFAACRLAAYDGHTAMLAHLRRSRRRPWAWNAKVAAFAAESGHLRTLAWLVQEGDAQGRTCPCDASAHDGAAFYGHLGVMKWLLARGHAPSASAVAYAAKGGHADVLRWLRAVGVPIDAEACTRAASTGHMALLCWLRSADEQGGQDRVWPWDGETVREAHRRGHWAIAKWALDRNCPCDDLALIAEVNAAWRDQCRGHLRHLTPTGRTAFQPDHADGEWPDPQATDQSAAAVHATRNRHLCSYHAPDENVRLCEGGSMAQGNVCDGAEVTSPARDGNTLPWFERVWLPAPPRKQ
jgi:hypothetical protein